MEEQNREIIRRLGLLEQVTADAGSVAKDHTLGMRELATRILALEQERERMQSQIDALDAGGRDGHRPERKKRVCEIKARLDAIDFYQGPADFQVFRRQLRIQLDTRYSFAGRWFAAMEQHDSSLAPTRTSMAAVFTKSEADKFEYEELLAYFGLPSPYVCEAVARRSSTS